MATDGSCDLGRSIAEFFHTRATELFIVVHAGGSGTSVCVRAFLVALFTLK